jgi:AraC-like DNA-binding protein
MLGNGLDAASAASRVGYHNAAHFNREYKNLFGVAITIDTWDVGDK